MALAVGHLAGEHRDRAVGLEPGAGLLHGARSRHDPHRPHQARRHRRRLHHVGQPEPEQPSLGAGRRLLRTEAVDVEERERVVEGPSGVEALQLHPGDAHRREVVGVQQVALPHHERVEVELAGDHVEQAFAHPGLDLPRTPVGDVGRLVGRDDHRLDVEVLEPVGRREQGPDDRRVAGGRVADLGVGALVEHQPEPDAEQPPVGVDRRLHVDALLAGLAADHEVLGAVLDPLHRPAEQQRGAGHGDVLARQPALLAEGPADVAAPHPHRVGGDPQGGRQVEAQGVGRLVARVDVELPGAGIVLGEHAPALHRDVGVAVLVEPGPHHPVGRGEGGVGVAVAMGRAVHHVGPELGEDRLGGAGQDVVHVAHSGQRVVVDLDRLGAVLGQRPGVGQHDGHRVAHQPHGVARQCRERREPQVGRSDRRQIGGHDGEVVGGDDGVHARHLHGGRDVDAGDAGMGERAAHEGGVQQARPLEVVDVATPPGEDAGVLDPLDADAGEAGDHQPSPSYSVSAAVGGGQAQLRGPHDAVDDALVARAAAEVARQRLPDRGLVGIGVVLQERGGGDQHPRRAEAALEGVPLEAALLHRVEAVAVGQPLDRRDGAAVGLHRQGEARPHRLPVEQDRARPAHPVLAAQVRAGQPEVVAEQLGERATDLASGPPLLAVHLQHHLDLGDGRRRGHAAPLPDPAARAAAVTRARRASVAATRRR